MSRSCAFAHVVGADKATVPEKLSGKESSSSLPLQKGKSDRFLRRPLPNYPAATVAQFCTAVLALLPLQSTALRADRWGVGVVVFGSVTMAVSVQPDNS